MGRGDWHVLKTLSLEILIIKDLMLPPFDVLLEIVYEIKKEPNDPNIVFMLWKILKKHFHSFFASFYTFLSHFALRL